MAKKKFDVNTFLNKIVQDLFQGVIVVAPVAVTAYVFWKLFDMVDGLLPGILGTLLPHIFNETTGFRRIPGLGFVVALIILIVIGRISSLFFVSRIMAFVDKLLEKTPGVKLIYTSVKDFLQSFAGSKKKFNHPVIVNVDAQAVWRIGFITQEDAGMFEMPSFVVVYVPHSYALSGITYIVPKEKIRALPPDIKSADAMKFAVSGGVTELEHHHHGK